MNAVPETWPATPYADFRAPQEPVVPARQQAPGSMCAVHTLQIPDTVPEIPVEPRDRVAGAILFCSAVMQDGGRKP